MKTNTKFLFSLLVLVATLFLTACSDDAQQSTSEDPAKREKADKVLAFREDMSFINRFVNENTMGEETSEAGRRSFASSTIARLKSFAPCMEGTEEELEDGSIKVTLNFGEGCETEEGIEVSGSVELLFTISESGVEYEIEFIDYSELNSEEHGGEVVNGTVTGNFILDVEASEFTQEMEQDLTITYPNQTEAIYRVAQAAEFSEVGLRVTSLSTSGNFADGGAFTMTLNKDLVYDFSCEGDLPVQGEEMLVFQGNHIKVSYGNGTCDDEYAVN